MKTITIWQPWASLIAEGWKTIETRSWPTNYRGILAIHASSRSIGLAEMGTVHSWLLAGLIRADWALRAYDGALPSGAIIATCSLVDCVPARDIVGGIGSREQTFGDYRAGRWAWLLRDCDVLSRPVKCRGKQRLWEWRCHDCSDDIPHTHCLDCGSKDHLAAECDMLG